MTSLPLWHRHRFRWANAVGFSLTVFMSLWLVTFLLGLLQHGFADFALPMPAAYAIVGGVSLVASIILLGIVLFGFVWKHADLNVPTARYLLFAWTCTGGLFFLSQSVALARFGPTPFPNTPAWLSELYWYFAPVGAVIFALLIWVNSEGHHYPWEAPDEDDYEYEEEHEHRPFDETHDADEAYAYEDER